MTPRPTGRHLARPLRALAIGLVVLMASPALHSLIRRTIVVDGDVSDWGDVLTDPENVVADAGSFSDPPDPDAPGTADRDLRGVAFTWDNTNLYLFFRRTLSGASSFDFLAYIDLDHDRLIESTDRIVRLSYNGAAFTGGRIYAYVPLAPGGDALTGDGVDEPGALGALQPGTPTSANSPDGIEFEAAVPWSALGLSPGSCLFIHPAIARGINLPSQIEDNTDPLDTQDVQGRLERDHAGSTASPGQVDYAHRACNDGSCGDRFDLSVRSLSNWAIDLFSDPNGDGDPSDGALLATDANGDGDFADPRDILQPGADSNGNGYPDTGSLAAGTCFTYVVRVHVPVGVVSGTTDVESVRARSATRPRELVRNRDETTVGPVTIVKDERRTGVPGDEVWIPHVACNHQGVTDTLDVSASSLRGWVVEIWSDPNGDGDPADGAPITTLGPLAPGACQSLLVHAFVPGAETPGVEDQITVTVQSRASPSLADQALDRVTVVAQRFTVTPNYDRDAGPGNALFLAHVITNNGSASDSFALSAVSGTAGWTLTLLTDPDGNGEPNDSAVIPDGSIVGPVSGNGGLYHFILRVDVPRTAPIGSTNTITITARSQSNTTQTAQATDVIHIRRTLTYSDPLFARPSKSFFTSCAKVYVQSHGLASNRDYRFVWIDPAGTTRRTSPTYQADARGRADDSFSLPCGIAPGTWTIKLQLRSGAAWGDVADGSANFSTLDPALDGGDITLLETTSDLYNRTGDTVSVESTLTNDTNADYYDTFVDYVIFKDDNGDQLPTAGEFYILSDGTRGTWAAGDRTHRTSPITVFSEATYEDFWQVSNVQFGMDGTWCVHARWGQICTSGSCSEVTIDTAVHCFQVSCLPRPQVDAGIDKRACAGTSVALSDSSSDGDSLSWDDGGGGGTFAPSNTVLHPTYSAVGAGTYTLTLTARFLATGCLATDSLRLIVDPLPVVSAGADKQGCVGDAIALSDSSGGAADAFAWSDGAGGGTFTPSSGVLHPTYTNAAAGTYTLSLTATVTATGCAATDTLTATVNSNPVVNAGADKRTCAGGGVALSDSSGGSADTFAWSDGGAGGAFSPSSGVLHPTYTPPDPSAGGITLTLTATEAATGCDSVDTLGLTVDANPVVDAGADKRTCAGDGVALSDSSAGTADTFAWSDSGAGGVFTPSSTVLHPTYAPPDPSPASVTLTFTATVAATGCDSVDTLVVMVDANPVIDAGANKTTCAGDGVALSDSSAGTADTFSWSDSGAGGTFTPSSSVLHPTYTPPDPSAASVTLTLTATVAATGCDSVDTLALTVNANPVVSAGADKRTCAGDGVALLDSSGGTADAFAWNDGGAGGTFSPSATVLHPTYTPPDPSPATVTLTFTATVVATGCDSVDTLVVTVDANPVVDAGADKRTCAGDGVALSDSNAGSADTFSWSDSGAGGTFTPSPAVLHPTYAPPDPSPSSVTLTFTATVAATGCDSVDTLAVTVDANPVIDAGANKTTCAGDGVALSDSSAGTADTFSWSDSGAGGTFTPSPTVLHPTYAPPDPSPATVTLTLTATVAATGCDSVDTLAVTVNANPVIDAGADKRTCAGDGVALSDSSAGAADTFSWSDSGAGGSFTPSSSVLHPTYAPPDPSPATITLTLTATVGSTGCDSVDTLVVTVDANPVVDAGAEKRTCAGDGVALSDSNAGSADTFSWSDSGAGGTFTPSVSVLHPTYAPPDPSPSSVTLTLTATVAATGCDSVDTLTVTVDANPVISAGADKRTCAGDGVALSDSTAGAADTFTWSDGGAGGSFTPSSTVLHPTYAPPDPSAATITLTLTATVTATGCDSVDTLSVTVDANPIVAAGGDKRACAGVGVSLSDSSGGTADAFSWSDSGVGGTFTPSSSVLHPTYSNATPGSYTLTLTGTVTASGCAASDALSVQVDAHPSVDAGADKEGCAGAAIELSDSSSSGDAFSWSDSGAGGSFSPSSSVLHPSYSNPTTGTYTLTLTARDTASGCSTSDTLTVIVRPRPMAAFTLTAGQHCEDSPTCFVDGSTGATSWSWQFGDPDASTSVEQSPCFSYSQPGTYTVTQTVTNACGSSTTSRTFVVDPKPVADFSYSTQGNRFCKDKRVNFQDLSTNAPTSWSWDFGDGATSNVQNPSHVYGTDGLFIVRLTACNSCGCSTKYEAVEIAATCNTNCEANSNQIECGGAGPATMTGNTCTDHDNFNTTSYPCESDISYTGENKSWDLNFLAGSNFIIRIVETDPEPNGYDLDIMLSDRCNPPRCIAWGDTELTYDDRTAANDDYFLIVDGRNGTCGPYRLEVDCIDPTESARCSAPDFDGVLRATDANPCLISGILVEWNAARNWGTGTDGASCSGGTYEIWRAPTSDPSAERRVGSARDPAMSFLDTSAVPGTPYVYRVHAINDCCAEPIVTDATATATDRFSDQPVDANAGPDRTLTCNAPTATLLGSASGGTGSGYRWAWSPAPGLSDPTIPNPVASLAGTYTLTVTDRGNGCTDTDTVTVVNRGSPTANAGADKTITCRNPVVTLDGSASGGDGSMGYAYSWSPGGPLSDPSSATPRTSTVGTYTLTVRDIATGCTATDTVTVTADNAPPTASAGPDRVLTCSTTSVVLDGSASGGNGADGYTYAWSPTAGIDDAAAQRPHATLPGTYRLTVTDVRTGCTGTDDVVVSQDRASPVASAGPDRTLDCAATPVTLDGSASGGNGSQGYSFAWSPPENVADPAAEDTTTTVAGTYTLTVTDRANGCTGTDTMVVSPNPNAPVANAGPDKDITCNVGTVTLEGSASGGDASQGYTFHWEPASRVSDPDVAQPTTSVPGTYRLRVTSVASGCFSEDVTVVADLTAPPVASAGPDKALTCAVTQVTLQGSASGSDGRSGYTFRWAPASDVSNPDIAQPTTTVAGAYTVTVTDVYTGCSAQDVAVVTVNRVNPVAGAGPDRVLDCRTTVVTLAGSASGGDGTQGYRYRWEPAAQVSNPDIAQPTTTAPGTYTLTVTDVANGCTSSDTASVTQDVRAPVANAGSDKVLTCTAPTATLAGSASGGNGSQGYDYRWEPAAQISNPDVAQPTTSTPGTYTLTVTDRANGCTSTDQTVVSDNRRVPIASAGADKQLTCTIATVTLDGSASGGDGSLGYSYRWAPAAQVSNPDVARPTTSQPGSYTLTVTDLADGCTSQDVVVVTRNVAVPVADAGADKRITCTAPSVTLDGAASGGDGSAGYSYRWEPAGQVSNPNIARPTTSTPGSYTLTVTDLANGCTGTDVANVTDDRVAPVASAGPDQVIGCASPTVTLMGSASGGDGSQGYTFHWEPANRVSNPDIAQPTTSRNGTYTLTVTDVANGCTATDTVVVTRDRNAPTANAGADKILGCSRTSVTLDGSASGGNGSMGYSYAWSPAAGLSDPASPTPTASLPGTYVLTVTDLANGCTGTDSVTVTRDVRAPLAEAGPARTITCASPQVTLLGSASGGNGSLGYDFAWTPAASLSDPASPTPTATLPGTYVLTVTDRANGCTGSDSVAVALDRRAPTANAGPDQVLDCRLPSVTLTGSASGGNGSLGYGYRWEPAGGVSSPDTATTQAIAAGIYTLTVTDLANGCTGTDQVTVTSPTPSPVADAGPDGVITCRAPVAPLRGTASGGDGSAGYTTTWSPTAGVADPSALVTTTTQPGSYTLLVVDNATGCRAVDATVIADGRLVPVVSAGPDRVIDCTVTQVVLSGSASGGDGSQGYTFSWAPAADVSDPSSATPTTSRGGTYVLTVTDVADGCTATDTVVVTADATAPVVSAGPDQSLDCRSSAVRLQGSASGGSGSYSYRWSPAAGLSDPTVATPTASRAGTFVLTVTDTASGCSASDTVVVTSDLRAPTAQAGPDGALSCTLPQAPLSGSASGGNGSAGYAFHWEPAGDVRDPDLAATVAFASGTYMLTVTDLANGCTATDTVVIMPAPGAPTADAGPDRRQTCAAPQVMLAGSASGGDGSQGYTFSWSPAGPLSNATSATPTTSTPGSYVLTVTDVATGCLARDVVQVIGTTTPLADAGPDGQLLCGQPQAALSGSSDGSGRVYRWEPAANVANPDVAVTTTSVAGTYTLTVTDTATGCSSSDTVVVLAPPPEPEPGSLDVDPSATPLRVAWADPVARTQLHLTWQDVGAFEYRVFQGTIANFLPPRGDRSYDHGALACGLRVPDAVVPVPPFNAYFLVVSANCTGVESSYGRDSRGRERPTAAVASGRPCP